MNALVGVMVILLLFIGWRYFPRTLLVAILMINHQKALLTGLQKEGLVGDKSAAVILVILVVCIWHDILYNKKEETKEKKKDGD
jgi:hypothetical protein